MELEEEGPEHEGGALEAQRDQHDVAGAVIAFEAEHAGLTQAGGGEVAEKERGQDAAQQRQDGPGFPRLFP
jgi:hypothetical protein